MGACMRCRAFFISCSGELTLALPFRVASPALTDTFLLYAASQQCALSFFANNKFLSTFQVCRVRCNNRRRAFELLASRGALQHDESKGKFRSNCSEKKSVSVIPACGTLVVSRIEFVAQVPRLFWLRAVA